MTLKQKLKSIDWSLFNRSVLENDGTVANQIETPVALEKPSRATHFFVITEHRRIAEPTDNAGVWIVNLPIKVQILV